MTRFFTLQVLKWGFRENILKFLKKNSQFSSPVRLYSSDTKFWQQKFLFFIGRGITCEIFPKFDILTRFIFILPRLSGINRLNIEKKRKEKNRMESERQRSF